MYRLFDAWLHCTKEHYGKITVPRNDGSHPETLVYDENIYTIEEDSHTCKIEDTQEALLEIPEVVSECFNTGKYDAAIVVNPSRLMTFLKSKHIDVIEDTGVPAYKFTMFGTVHSIWFVHDNTAVVSHKWELFDFLSTNSKEFRYGCLRYNDISRDWICNSRDTYNYDSNVLLCGCEIPEWIGNTPICCDMEWDVGKYGQNEQIRNAYATLWLGIVNNKLSTIVSDLSITSDKFFYGDQRIRIDDAIRLILCKSRDKSVDNFKEMDSTFICINRDLPNLYLSSKHYKTADREYVLQIALHSKANDKVLLHITSAMLWDDVASSILVHNDDSRLFLYSLRPQQTPALNSFEIWMKYAKDMVSVKKIQECADVIDSELFDTMAIMLGGLL